MTPDEQLYAKILTAVSPSNIGEYAGCPKKLVLDAQTPRVFSEFLVPYSAFGTVAHWYAQHTLITRGIAVAANLKPPDEQTIKDAMRCKGVPAYANQFLLYVRRAAVKAADIIQLVSPLPRDTHWVVEKSSYNPGIMPARLGRKGNISGFGGSIDVLRSDRGVLWDFKFVGNDKVPSPLTSRSSKPDAGISNQYLWQMGSYHITEDVPQTGILWTSRDSETVSYLLIDWTQPKAKELAQSIRGFINFVTYKDFHKVAWPIRGPNCKYCAHHGLDGGNGSCPAWAVLGAESPAAMSARAGLAELMDLDSIGAVTGTLSLFD